jgi:cold shock CspA family protein
MEEGTIKLFDSSTGVGYIARKTGEDVSVDSNSFIGNELIFVAKGEPVLFNIEKSSNGLRAINVVRVSHSTIYSANSVTNDEKLPKFTGSITLDKIPSVPYGWITLDGASHGHADAVTPIKKPPLSSGYIKIPPMRQKASVPNDIPEVTPISVDIWIDPGESSKEDIIELYDALSELHRAVGGIGVTILDESTKIYSLVGSPA